MSLPTSRSIRIRVLKSKMWYQTLDEVVRNPYDYENQRSFIKESRNLLEGIYKLYDTYQLKFHLDNRSVKKCVWMLQIDALDTLRDCLYLLEKKKHRLVGKMFRDIVETLDITHLIKQEPNKYLAKWYDNEIIPTQSIEDTLRERERLRTKESRSLYENLSLWTHHTYFALKNSYSLGGGNMLVYDSHYPRILVLPQTISQYLHMLSILIRRFLYEMRYSELFDKDKLAIFEESNLFKE